MELPGRDNKFQQSDRHHALWTQGDGIIRLAVVGDVHYNWGPEDRAALKFLGADATLLLGDFGEEAEDIVADVAQIQEPFAVILGNHDAWYSLDNQASARHSGVDRQLHLLSKQHVGYGATRFSSTSHPPFSVVGARPFSMGGPWRRAFQFYKLRYGMTSMKDSAEKIAQTIRMQPISQPVVVIAHNGPRGLGNKPQDPCGLDFKHVTAGRPLEGDFGDEDLEVALSAVATECNIPLVLFGHMHHRLHYISGGGHRNMAHIDCASGRVCLNAAVVPRKANIATVGQAGTDLASHFMVVELEHGIVTRADHVWVHVPVEHGVRPHVAKVEPLLRTELRTSSTVQRSVYLAHTQQWSAPIKTQVE